MNRETSRTTQTSTVSSRGVARALVLCIATACGVLPTCQADARDLRQLLSESIPGQEGRLSAAIAPLGGVIGSQIADQLPTLATSASFVYEFDPATDTFARSALTYGPLFSERAITVGKNRLNVDVSYSYVRFTSFNGADLSHLKARVAVGDLSGKTGFSGFRRPDLAPQFPGLSPDQMFTQATLDLDLEAQLFALALTFGVLDDLDVNVNLPIIRTFVRRTITEQTLDPRYGALLPPELTGPNLIQEFSNRGSALGIGDIRFRAKYLVAHVPVHLAGLLDLAVPTGSPGNFQGTGHTRITSSLIASHVFPTRIQVEPHFQAGVEFDVDDVAKSQAKYAAGVSAQLFRPLALTIDFLGRSEFNSRVQIPSSARLPEVHDGAFVETAPPFHGRPLFVDIKRNDILELSLGVKIEVWGSTILFANAIVPLNNDGLRADVVPTVGVEGSF